MPHFTEAKPSYKAIFRAFAFYRSHDVKTEALPGRCMGHRERDCQRHTVGEREWKKVFSRGIEAGVPSGNRAKIVNGQGTAVLQVACARNRSSGKRERGGDRWSAALRYRSRRTEAALLNSHPIDTLSSRGMCESIGTKHAKYRRSVTTSMMLKVDMLRRGLTRILQAIVRRTVNGAFNEEEKICNILL